MPNSSDSQNNASDEVTAENSIAEIAYSPDMAPANLPTVSELHQPPGFLHTFFVVLVAAFQRLYHMDFINFYYSLPSYAEIVLWMYYDLQWGLQEPSMNFIDLEIAIKKKNHKKIYEILAQKHFDINNQQGHGGSTPLLLAVQAEDEELTAVFLRMGANPNCALNNDCIDTPLRLAASNGNENLVALLLKYGANEIDNQGDYHLSALYLAAARGHKEIVRLLLDYRFNPNLPVRDTSAIGNARDHVNRENSPVHAEIVSDLEKYENYPMSSRLDKTPVIIPRPDLRNLLLLIQRKYRLPAHILKMITFYCVAGTTKYATRPVIESAAKNDLEKLREQVHGGALIDARGGKYDRADNSALFHAVDRGNVPMTKFLIDRGVSITPGLYPHTIHTFFSYKNKWSSLYELAQSKNQPEIAALLLETKRKQLAIFKEAFNLEKVNPRLCTL